MAEETIRQIVSRKEAKAIGLPRYFTGIPCPYGHVAERRTGGANCLLCEKEWFTVNAGRANEHKKKWKTANPDKRRQVATEWYRRNAEAEKEKNRNEYREKRDEILQRKRAWARSDHNRAYFREYRKRNIEQVRSIQRNNRARRKGATGSHAKKDILAIFVLQDGRCSYCSIDLSSGYHVDHVVSLAKGGSNDPDNLCLSCPTCNVRKQDTTAGEFRARLLSEAMPLLQ